MLNAAEASMEMSAEDEADWQRQRAKLYAPPQGYLNGPGRRARPPGTGLSRAQAQTMAAQLAAEDARLAGGRTS
ncbi:hypothetical protein ABZX75_17685 [Streptomyces sp. NPDC003038]|uniref:hypothetical protein n=1 Tax=unclassified Streptomyces TaxID=2593676 RepID=UPI0033A4051B